MLILKLSCPDRPGIVAKISSYIASHGGNLLEFNQFTNSLDAKFFARIEMDIDQIDVSMESFIKGFEVLGESLDATWHFRPAPFKVKTAILVTKTTHCLNEILWRAAHGDLPLEITSIIGNREDCKAIAEKEGIPFHYIEMDGDQKAEGFKQIAQILINEEVELGILARFMQILPDWFCSQFAGKLINIHHSFLPAFIGANPYRQAYDRGVKLIGATCHYVTSDLDAGPIIDQEVKRVLHSHSPQDLMRLGRDCERIALARGIRYHAYDRTIIDGNRAIVFED
ncbi:formyltetrahydrofolate deformylase [Rubritalea squalenifaciens DSM 18772]|uniref:Formyltetrahydrofolate deformylase n=1 Tax=Rubritalea squalenifaciens DSM 18772 TaxID=1123071 RepID=A0A1M6PUN8_9BACT|nr:formyltetrahydrofolate deformylase [Rubritalea squalenifaciens]SHK11560.1 formyltetrahydrofolate deformylase [Rubritalea squalenifaciens DSM 18772]